MSQFKELNISNPGTSTQYGGNDTDLINKLFNGVVAGIPPVTIKTQNKFGFWDNVLWVENQAATKKTNIRGQVNSPATDVDLALPPITGNDTLSAIGLQNIWSVPQQFNAGILHQEMAEPSSPSAGMHQMYVDSSSKHLMRKNSSGALVDYDVLLGGGGALTSLLGGYKYFIYFDSVANRFKAVNGKTGVVDYTSTVSTDAQPVIQNAINANSNAPGVILLAPNTTFPLETIVSGSPNRSLNLRSGQTIKGGGPSSKLITRSTGGGIIGLYGKDVTDVILEDFTIDGRNTTGDNNTSNQGGNILITATAVTGWSNRIWCNRVSSMWSAEASIKFVRTKNGFMTNNYVEGSQLLTPPTTEAYAGLEFSQASENGLIMGNNIQNCGGEAIGLYGTATGDSNARMIISNNNMAITSTSPLAQNHGGRGHILIEGDATAGSYNENTIIANNNILSNYYGINLKNTGRCEVYGNHIYMTGFTTDSLSGIHFTGLGYDTSVHDNDIHDPGTYGIEIDSPRGRISVRNNRIYNPSNVATNTYDGIYVWAASGKIVDNVTLQGNNITDDRGGSKKMRDGIRLETVGTGTIINLLKDDNFTTGETGSKINIIGTGHNYRRNKGTTALNGGGTTINIPHKLASTPSTDGLTVLPLSSDALGSFYVTVDATNIILNYPIATPSGTANLSYAWSASIQR